MKRDLESLTREPFDLVVVGGGIYGACALWDATLRGLSAALIEKGDFGHATSAHSFKIVHGGIRYLQHLDLPRIRQSSRERRALLRIAPHLVEPLPIVIPTYGHGRAGKAFLGAGSRLYDLLVADRNRGIRDPDRRIPASRTLSRRELLSIFPQSETGSLTGGVLFHDAQMYNPPRLVLAFVRSAAERGAAAANYVECVDFLRQEDRIVGIRARDLLSGDRFDIRARLVLNAAGPWAETLLARSIGVRLARSPTFSRDAAFVYKRQIHHELGLAIQGRTRDPDALVGRPARHLFIVPWRDYSLVGVWHRVHEKGPERFRVTDQELRAWVGEANEACPSLDLSIDEIGMWNAGLVLFGENDPEARHLRYGHRSILEDHARRHGIDGLVTLLGVRYTTARSEAERAVDLVFRKLGRKPPRSETETMALFGGDITGLAALEDQACREHRSRLSPSVLRRLIRNHGSEHDRVLRHVGADPSMALPLGDFEVIGAEVVQAVREEMAIRLGDVVFRRTDLGTAEHPGHQAVLDCARIMARELGWGDSTVAEEVSDVAERLALYTPGGRGAAPASSGVPSEVSAP